MKCPNCGEEVSPGNLYCPKCLEEVPWVSEYNTVETLESKNEYDRRKRIQAVKKQLKKYYFVQRRRRIFVVVFLTITCVSMAGGGCAYYAYHSHNSYGYQYQKAENKYRLGSYESALEYIERALELDPDHEEAYVLLSQILYASGDEDGAKKVLAANILNFEQNEQMYRQLIQLYEEAGEYEKIKELLDSCEDSGIRQKFDSFITPDPVTNYETGTYNKKFKLKISGSCEEIYYTLDGSVPSKNSIKYEGPIQIDKGVTEIYIIGYSHLGIPSDVVYRKYVVE